MAGQGIERRDMLRVLAMAAAAGQFPGFHRWAFACAHQGEGDLIPAPAARYTPQFFTADEYTTLDQLTALILPTTDTPGAREAGVSEFIDFMVAHDPSIQYDFRFGLGWLDMHARQLHQHAFRELDPPTQTELLRPLAVRVPKGEAPLYPGLEEGRAFFTRIRRYTLMGFYTSRVGLEQLGYPGLQIYTESQGCPHPDDPEHLHLKPGRGRA
jgi:gluconate 2-dehydrogenase gamma chain